MVGCEVAIERDVELIQALGFNGVRSHQKIEDPRFLRVADERGLLVWSEMPSAYRFTRRAALGAAAGTVAGMLAIAALPDMTAAGGFLTGLGFQGWGWLWPLMIPPVAAVVGFLATRRAALRMLREVR